MGVPISNVTRRVVFAPSGTGPYAFTFEILAATDIEVYKGDTLLTLTTDYTVTINTNGTGSVTLVATAGTDNITIIGARAIERTTDFVTGGDFFANTVNTELDSLTIFAQQNAEAVERALRAPETDPTTINMTLPRKADRAGKYLAFDANGNPEPGDTSQEVAIVAANINSINTVKGEITPVNNISTVAGAAANIATVAGISANVTTVAGISGNVTTVAGISADVTAVAGDATDIGTVAGLSTEIAALGPIAADITTVAGIDSDVTAVAADATDIGAVAAIAANVTTVAGIAANVTTVAGISSDVTTVATNVTDITNFSDVYLGPSGTDPATRNDSSALQAGDLYFDTVADVMKVYTGSAWIAAYVPSSGFLQVANNLSDVANASTARQNLDLEIGVDVQAFDADTAKLDVAQSFTAKQTFGTTTKIEEVLEKITVSATAATGTINFDALTQGALYYTTDASGNWTVNVRGDGSTSLNTMMATGESLTVVFLVTQGSTAYYNSAFQVDGSSVTPKWQGGSAPTEGNASGVDAYTYVIVKTGSATFTVFASVVAFA